MANAMTIQRQCHDGECVRADDSKLRPDWETTLLIMRRSHCSWQLAEAVRCQHEAGEDSKLHRRADERQGFAVVRAGFD